MSATDVSLVNKHQPGGFLRRFLTERLRTVLEHRSVRIVAVGACRLVASLFSLIPTPLEVDTGWLYLLPVAIASIAGGLREGLVVAGLSAAIAALNASVAVRDFDDSLFVSVVASKFVLYGMISAILGPFADAHYAVQASLRRLASIDPLTQVSNVTSFYEELRITTAHNGQFAIMLVDVDGLKALNDEHGHQVGSTAIQMVATVLRRVVRGVDCVARFGGDEFVVILRDADRAGAQIVRNRVDEMLADQILAGTSDKHVTVSSGVAIYGEDGTSVDDLLTAADEAMYREKRARKRAELLKTIPASATQ